MHVNCHSDRPLGGDLCNHNGRKCFKMPLPLTLKHSTFWAYNKWVFLLKLPKFDYNEVLQSLLRYFTHRHLRPPASSVCFDQYQGLVPAAEAAPLNSRVLPGKLSAAGETVSVGGLTCPASGFSLHHLPRSTMQRFCSSGSSFTSSALWWRILCTSTLQSRDNCGRRVWVLTFQCSPIPVLNTW